MNLIAAVMILVSLVMPPVCLADSSDHQEMADVGMTLTVDCPDAGDGDGVRDVDCNSACCCGDFLPSCHFFHPGVLVIGPPFFVQALPTIEVSPEIFVPPESSA